MTEINVSLKALRVLQYKQNMVSTASDKNVNTGFRIMKATTAL